MGYVVNGSRVNTGWRLPGRAPRAGAKPPRELPKPGHDCPAAFRYDRGRLLAAPGDHLVPLCPGYCWNPFPREIFSSKDS